MIIYSLYANGTEYDKLSFNQYCSEEWTKNHIFFNQEN